MRHTFVKIYFSQPFVIIFCLGLLLLILGLLRVAPDFWGTFLQVVGTSFMAVALSAPISEFFQFQTLSKHMGILRGAQDSGIIHIFKSRLEDRDSFNKALEKEFAQADKLLLACIALPQLFLNPPYPEPIDEKLFNPDFPMKILLLDPGGVNAKERANIETGRGTIRDIERTIGNLQLILKERAKTSGIDLGNCNIIDDVTKKIKMEVHLYDFAPSAFMIMTDECLFMEQYHLGRLPNTRPSECIGGRTPILQFTPRSLTYKIMEQHFNYIWENNSRDITKELLMKDAF